MLKLPHLDMKMNNAEELREGIWQKLRTKSSATQWDSSNNHVFHLFVIRTETERNYKSIYMKMEYRP
jgi:hypothetical protein